MSFTVYLALFGWIPLTIVMFSFWPARRAAFSSLILGYLFLPVAMLKYGGFVDITKPFIIGVALLIGILLMDSRRLSSFRFRWFDLPILVWCLSPMATSITNGLGPYDGLSGMLTAFSDFTVPYFVGRLYVRSVADARALALALAIGGLVYVPFVLFEVRMSPVLHHMVYGFNQHVFAQTRRFGGWRPMVFLQHGLAIGVWMSATSVVAVWLWQAKRLGRIWLLPAWVSVVLLITTTVLSKSLGALLILGLALLALFACRWFRTTVPLLLFILFVPVYLTARIALKWQAEPVVAAVKAINQERGESLEGRILADERIRGRAMLRPAFGWGGYNRFRLGLGPTLPDSLWAIVLGKRGFVGLLSIFGCLVLAPLLALRRLKRMGGTVMTHPEIAGLIGALAIFNLDLTVNAMLSPVFMAVAGALMGLDPRVSGGVSRAAGAAPAVPAPGARPRYRLDRPSPAPEVRR